MGTAKDRRVLSPEAAARRYYQSLVQGRGVARDDGDMGDQAARYKMARAEHDFQMATVKQWLYEQGVPLLHVVTWLNFARHMDKVCRGYSSQTCNLLARAAVDRWERIGLDRKLLVEMCQSIYNVTPAGEGSGADAPLPEPAAQGPSLV